MSVIFRSFVWLAPLTLVVHCVGDDSTTPKDSGSDVTITDGNPTDVSPSDGNIPDAEAGIPLTGAFASALVLPDTTVVFGGPAPVTSAGDVIFAGDLTDLSGTVSINNLGYVSNGSHDWLILRLAENNGFKWVKSFGGASDDRAYAVTADANGDVYLAGAMFCSTANTTISVGAQTFVCKHTGYSSAVAKLNGADGVPKWLTSFEIAVGANGQCTDIRANPSNGNVAVSCSISGDFSYTDTGNVTHNVTHPNGSNGDVFIAELDPATGKVARSLYYASASTQAVNQLAYDAAGDLHVAGSLTTNTNVFVPAGSGAAAFTLTKKGTATSEGVAFKVAATTWAHVWDNVFSGTGNCAADAIAVDSTGAAFASVTFAGTQTFASSATAAGGQDTIVVALSNAGAPTAQLQIGANGVVTSRGRLTLDASNAIVVAGQYSGTGNGPKIGTTTLPATTSGVNFVGYTAKLSHDLTSVSWVQANAPQANDAGSANGVQFTGVAIDPTNQQIVEVGALITATADFGDGTPVARKQEGIFVLRRNP